MINTEENPTYLNSFLEYSAAYKRKSPDSVVQYNYDLNMFLKFMKYHFHLSTEDVFEEIKIADFSLDNLKKIHFKKIELSDAIFVINKDKYKKS